MRLSLFVPLLIVSIAGMLVLTVWVFPSTGDFREENPFWNGLKDFRREFSVEPLTSLGELPTGDSQPSVLVVIPYQPFTPPEIRQLRDYLMRGGVVVLADDFGDGNTVLEGLGLTARFTGDPVLDPLFNYRTDAFPLATRFGPSPITADVEALAMNHATSIDDAGLTTIARFSPFSYVDANNNGRYDIDEPIGSLAAAGYAAIGAGEIIVVADPSIFISAMLGSEDNTTFVRNLMERAGPDARAFIDQSHLPPSRLDESKNILATVREAGARTEVLAGVTGGVAVILLAPVWRRRKGATA